MTVEELRNGRAEYNEYSTPEKWIAASAMLVGIGFGELFFPGFIGWFFKLVDTRIVQLFFVSISEILFIAILILVHESIHVVAAVARGYVPDWGIGHMETFWVVKEPHPYIVVLDEHLSRVDNLVMLLSPFVIINIVALIIWFSGLSPVIGYYAKITLVVNTAGSVADVYHSVRVLRMPKGTKFINIMEEEIRTFYTTSD